MKQGAQPRGATLTLVSNTETVPQQFSIFLPLSQYFLFQLRALHFLPIPLSGTRLSAGLQRAVLL